MDEELQSLPQTLAINAWTGTDVPTGEPSPDTKRWLVGHGPTKVRAFLKAPPKVDPKDWRHPRVGWGLVLPHNPALPPDKWSTADDAPEPIRELVKQRGADGVIAPVLRYRPGTNRIGFLHRDGADLPVSQSGVGSIAECVPRYLLLYGTPEEIPWEEQYSLNATRAVGRLELTGEALENYVAALMTDWKTQGTANPDAAVVWAVDHGPSDITSLMRKAVAERVLESLHTDTTVGPNTRYLNGSVAGEATRDRLAAALTTGRPAFVLTTSHGQTGPLDNVKLMGANLGLPVDADRALVRPSDLAAWDPGGAIWYAHACCSAGSDAQTVFDGLVGAGSLVDQVLKGVCTVGARVAPLPTALLGHKRPLRAFVGHVEPTFDWTLQQKITRQFLTEPLATALYDNLYQPFPIGLAMESVYGPLGGIYAEWDRFSRRLNQPNMLHRMLVARDIQSTVILGDPTAMLPIA